MTLDQYITWFKAHERLVIIALVIAFGVHGINKWLDKRVTDAQAQAAVAQQSSADQKEAVAKLQASVTQQAALFQSAQEANQKEIASLVAAMASRDAASNKKIAQVTAPTTPPQAVNDLNAAYPTLPIPLVPTDQGANVPTADLQQFTATKIEDETAKADLAGTTTQLRDSQDSLSKAVALVSGKDSQITALNVLVDKNAKSCEDDKKVLKAEASRSKWRWFWAGLAAGFTGRSLLK